MANILPFEQARSEYRDVSLSWAAFLDNAPAWPLCIHQAETDFGVPDYKSFAPLTCALVHFQEFCAQMESGGLVRYFDALSPVFTDFEQVPTWVAVDPALTEAAELCRKGMAIWSHVKGAFLGNQNDGEDWLDRLEQLQVAHGIDIHQYDTEWLRFIEKFEIVWEGKFLQNVEKYVSFKDVDGVYGTGREAGEVRTQSRYGRPGGRWQLNFLNGFPYGPNLFFSDDAREPIRMVRFSADRQYVEYDGGDYGSEKISRNSVDYRTGLSASRVLQSDVLGSPLTGL